MNRQANFSPHTTLFVMLVTLCAASLLHFVHNATYLRDYPNLPASLTPFGVYAAWIGMTAIGVAGYTVFQSGAQIGGLAIIAIYALLGFAGLDHYSLAPIAAHSAMMNTSIVIEVAAAAVLLMFTIRSIVGLQRVATTN